MGNKDFFRALFWAMAIFLIWQMVSVRLWPSAPPAGQPTTTAPANGGLSSAAPSSRPTAGAASAPAGGAGLTAAEASSTLRAVGAETEEIVTLGDTSGFENSPYRMRLELCSRGAAVDNVELSDHRQTVHADDRYRLLERVPRGGGGFGQPWRSLTIEQVAVDNRTVRMDDLAWEVTRREEGATQTADFRAVIHDNDQPIIELVRTYALPAQPREQMRSDLSVTLSVRNLSAEPHDVIITELGPVGLPHEGGSGTPRKLYAAVEENGAFRLVKQTCTEVAKRGKYPLFDSRQEGTFLWLGAGNLYFTGTMCPVDEEGKEQSAAVAEVSAVDLDQDKATETDSTTRMVTRPLRLEPGGQQVLRAAWYLGGKDREIFEFAANADYVRRQYIVEIKENYGSCTFNFLTDWMIRLLNALEGLVRNFGVAIIILVIIVRVLLHPVTKKTQVNMVRMQQNMASLQPKLDEVRRKFPNDAHRQQQEIMKAYREAGISPFGQMAGCLPMFLQMPIWVALWSSINNNLGMRGRGFVWWINDLTSPDYIYAFAHPVTLPVLGQVTGLHLLPILVGIFMFAQQKLMPKPKTDTKLPRTAQTEQAEQMQKIMPYMSLVMILLFYKFPSGLNLYIMISSMLGTVEQLYIRKHVQEKLQAPAADTKPPVATSALAVPTACE